MNRHAPPGVPCHIVGRYPENAPHLPSSSKKFGSAKCSYYSIIDFFIQYDRVSFSGKDTLSGQGSLRAKKFVKNKTFLLLLLLFDV